LCGYIKSKGELMSRWNNNFDDVRFMNKYELKAFIRDNRGIQKTIMKGRYSEEERMLSSQVIYAKNRLRLQTN